MRSRVAGAVLLMRSALLMLAPALALARLDRVAAQTVERTDTPKQGVLRVTFDPRILTWDRVYTGNGLASLGAPLTGDTVGAPHIPLVARLQQDVRTASGIPDFVATLGHGLLAVYQERRVTPLNVELGVTSRLSLAVTVPVVRTATRAALQLSQANANLGSNPRATLSGADQQYTSFFGQFSTALAQLRDSVATGHYGCPLSPECAQAQALLTRGDTLHDALQRMIYGVGGVASPFVPLISSSAGIAIASGVAQVQQQLQTTFHVPGFTASFLLAADTLSAPYTFDAYLPGVVGANGAVFGWGYNPFRYAWRLGLGDVELAAKYRLVAGGTYAAALGVLARLPTGTRDSTLEVLDAAVADHQLDLEGRVTQELTLAHRLWLNLSVRGGTQRPGTRARRVSPLDAFLVPFQATTVLNWDPGDYAAIDFAPLYRFLPQFAAGVTIGYWSKRADQYSYRTAQDSLAIATALGAPTPANVLDQGTSARWLRLGVAFTYTGPAVESGFTVERTVSGAGGQVAAATVYRLVLRISRKLF